MSVQFGKCTFDQKPVDRRELDRVRPLLVPYGPDSEGYLCKDNIGVLYRAFHTTKESKSEVQPHASHSGAVITWDGRLDNREDLLGQFRSALSSESSDLQILAAAYERWGVDSFRKLTGDWAVSIWDPSEQSVLLAKDAIGTRHLYYAVENGQLTWCTILDPFLLFAEHGLALEEEYIAGWLSFFPATHLTPYVGIHSVQPSCYVRFTKGARKAHKYWEFDPDKRIHYRSDSEYEEHFRVILAEAVRRRLRSASPVLAELSGGMDSSSIVCVADNLMSRGSAGTSRLDTISYYDDSEPNWNERPFFSKVEARRGRTGCHIDVSKQDLFRLDPTCEVLLTTPGSIGRVDYAAKELATLLITNGNRVVLSGIGGDEVTGGVPTPVPELADLLVQFRLKALVHQLRTWALNKRQPLLHLVMEVVRQFLPLTLVGVPRHRRPAPWLSPQFATLNRAALQGYPSRLKFFGPRPSFQDNLATLNELQRQLECLPLPTQPLYEKRYPYLDRDLLEFVYAIDRDQLLRPGHRRSLMRRALAGIVPDDVLNRRRKAYVARAPIAALATALADLGNPAVRMICAQLRVIDQTTFVESIRKARSGREVLVIALTRALQLEQWLQKLPAVCCTTARHPQRNRSRFPAAGKLCQAILDIHHGSERR